MTLPAGTRGIMKITSPQNIHTTKTRVGRILARYKRINHQKTDGVMKWTIGNNIRESGPWIHVNMITTK